MSNKELDFDVVLIADDYVSLDFHSFFGKGNIVRKLLMYLSNSVVFAGMVLVTIKYWYMLPVTCIIIFYPLILRYTAIYRFKSERGRKLREPMHYIVTPHSLSIEGESFSKTYQWNNFKETTENRNSFYFWETDSYALLLPKRNMSKEDINYVRTVSKRPK